MPGGGLVRLERVASTQDVIHGFAAEGAAHGTVVVAGEQTGGRGRRGRSWSSPPGGAWVSVLYRPATSAAAELLSVRVGLAAAAVLDELVGAGRVRLKWPNDLMLADGKLGGVLCEARWQGDQPAWVAAGVGINVSNDPPPDARIRGARLADVEPDIRVDDLLASLVPALRGVPATGDRLTASERQAYAARDWLRGRTLVEPVAGVAAGLDETGALLVQTPQGTTGRVRAGSVVPSPVVSGHFQP